MGGSRMLKGAWGFRLCWGGMGGCLGAMGARFSWGGGGQIGGGRVGVNYVSHVKTRLYFLQVVLDIFREK